MCAKKKYVKHWTFTANEGEKSIGFGASPNSQSLGLMGFP